MNKKLFTGVVLLSTVSVLGMYFLLGVVAASAVAGAWPVHGRAVYL
jgi:hypothetical protein